MPTDMNHWTGVGRMVRDAELKYTQGGSSFANFSIAVGYSFKQGEERKEKTSFFDCIAWGKQGEAIAQYVKKGHRVGIEGRLQQETWDDKEGKKRSAVKIVVERFHFLQPKNADAGTPPPVPQPAENEGENPFADEGDPPF